MGLKKISAIFIAVVILSCSNNDSTQELFNAVVVGKGLDCGNAFLIRFNDDVPGLPENTFENIYYEVNLPEAYKVEGKQLYVEFRNIDIDKDKPIICTHLGPGYPFIYVLSAREVKN